MTRADDAEPDYTPTIPPPAAAMRPFWLRPAALAMIVGVHGFVLLTTKGTPLADSPADVVEVALVAQGESAESQTPVDEVVPAAPPPSPTPAEAQPAPELSAPPPAVAEAEALPLAPPKADAAPKETAKNENGPDRSEQKQPPPPKKAPARPDLSERRQTAREARQEARRGAKTGVASGGLSRASYASLVSAEINRRRFYPSAARASGASGEVGVAFTIGPSGRVVRYAITYSSGSSALDGAARSILAAIHAPPPPGGSFAANTSIRFHLD